MLSLQLLGFKANDAREKLGQIGESEHIKQLGLQLHVH